MLDISELIELKTHLIENDSDKREELKVLALKSENNELKLEKFQLKALLSEIQSVIVLKFYFNFLKLIELNY